MLEGRWDNPDKWRPSRTEKGRKEGRLPTNSEVFSLQGEAGRLKVRGRESKESKARKGEKESEEGHFRIVSTTL